jgi:hypothetical protein
MVRESPSNRSRENRKKLLVIFTFGQLNCRTFESFCLMGKPEILPIRDFLKPDLFSFKVSSPGFQKMSQNKQFTLLTLSQALPRVL